MLANIISDLLSASTSPITAIIPRVYNASGTYTPSAGLTFALVEAVGGGGAGGGAVQTTTTPNSGGDGGSAGAYASSILTAAEIGSSVSITIGAGGTGVSGGNGNNGGDTLFGSLITAGGGKGGGMRGPSTVPKVGLYSSLSTAAGGNLFNLSGATGQPITSVNSSGTFQTAGLYSVGLWGLAGANSGGGGSSVFNLGSSTAKAGSAGSAGKVIVWEFVSVLAAAKNMIGKSSKGIIVGTKRTSFSANDTWVPDSAAGFALVLVQAIGGNGAGCSSTAGLNNGGGGGGGGGFAMSFYTKSQFNALPSKTIVISSTLSSFSSSTSIITANKGTNGSAGTAAASGGIGGYSGGTATGGNIFNGTGGASSRVSWQSTAPAISSGGTGYMGLASGGNGSAVSGANSAGGGAPEAGYVDIIEFLVS